jgi:endonuclease/exonuclease/phosphatase family metal-dependent hydrolase
VAAAAEDDASKYGHFVAVANTHVLFNPKRGDIKLAQLRLLLHHLQVLIAAAVPEDQAGHVPAMIMGDFNSKPDTPLYRFMRQGAIDCLKHHRKDMAGGFGSATPSDDTKQSGIIAVCACL